MKLFAMPAAIAVALWGMSTAAFAADSSAMMPVGNGAVDDGDDALPSCRERREVDGDDRR